MASVMFNCMVATVAIFDLLEELVGVLPTGDLSAGSTVDSSGVWVVRGL